MQLPLTFDTIGDLDGGAARAIVEAAVREALNDLDDRGEDDKPRQVQILLSFTRREDGMVETHVEACAKIPRRRTASTIARLRRQGNQSQLYFQQWDNADPDQRTIDEIDRPHLED